MNLTRSIARLVPDGGGWVFGVSRVPDLFADWGGVRVRVDDAAWSGLDSKVGAQG